MDADTLSACALLLGGIAKVLAELRRWRQVERKAGRQRKRKRRGERRKLSAAPQEGEGPKRSTGRVREGPLPDAGGSRQQRHKPPSLRRSPEQ